MVVYRYGGYQGLEGGGGGGDGRGGGHFIACIPTLDCGNMGALDP